MMKKRMALFLLTALFVWLAAGALAQDFPYTTTSARNVNMRRSASGTSVVLEKINEGDALTIMGESGDYYYVLYNGRTGYAMKIYVDGDKVIATAAPSAVIEAGTATGYPYTTTTTAKVNLRQYASTSSTVLTQIDSGASITVKGISGSFAQVTYGTRTGYVMTDYIVLKTIVSATSTPAPTPVSVGYSVLSTGSTGSEVKALQQALIELGYLASGYATGNYQSKTTAAVKSCQTKNGLTATGVADAAFQALLFEGSPKNASGTATAVKVLPATGTATMRKGNYGDVVTALQQRLIALGYLADGKATGTYDDLTIAAVTTFQRDNGIAADGVAGAVTINAIYAKPVPGAGTPAPTAAPTIAYTAPAGTVRQGTIGAAATTVQLRLAQLGYYTGLADGNFGTGSVAALKAFQTRNGLKVDGVCGTGTKAVLFGQNALPAQETASPTVTPGLPAVATATPTVAYAAPAEKVQQGTTGMAATTVQLRLAQLGYYTGEVDGNFGSGSVAALVAFQAANGLNADGVCGSGTKALLFSANAIPVATAAPTATILITKDNCVTIRNGSSGVEVLNLQRRLTELGYYSARMDGQCLADDVAAIRAFQSANGLSVDGAAGYDTQVLLFSANAKGPVVVTATPAPVATATPAATPAPTKITYTTLRYGSSGMAVKTMQDALITLKYLTSSADGVYGTGTKAAVAAFQGNNGLISDGVAGPLTLTKLYSGSAKANGSSAGATATPAPNAVTGSVQTGDTGDMVKALQTRLIELGYLTGPADGVFGMATYRALVSFQSANGLSADGIAGTQTLGKLNSSTAQSAATATPAPTVITDIYAVTTTTASSIIPVASKVKYANWYDVIRPLARQYPYVTVYDPATGISWNVHLFSLGDHADCEPLTAADTAKMMEAFGGVVAWEPVKPVWVIFPDGQIYIATTHDVPHSPEHRTYNNFEGHVCIHFPRTASQVAAIGPYATRHQAGVDAAWKALQESLGK